MMYNRNRPYNMEAASNSLKRSHENMRHYIRTGQDWKLIRMFHWEAIADLKWVRFYKDIKND